MTDREKLIEILSTKICPREGVSPVEVVADFLLDNDVIPIVRCKNCKYSRKLNDQEDEIYMDFCRVCEHRDASQDGYMVVVPNHYCSYRERNDSDEQSV